MGFGTALTITRLTVGISQHIYFKILDKKANVGYLTDITMSIYDTIITSFGNSNVMFAAT